MSMINYLIRAMPPIARAASNRVCSTITPTGAMPTSVSVLSEVFTPSAATAVSRHQLEIGVRKPCAGPGIQPTLLTITSMTKATRNHGSK